MDVADLRRRFDALWMPEPNTGCWLWLGTTADTGYGVVVRRGKRVGAHRLIWELTYGAAPGELCVCHRCDTPSCVNPDHLFLGTKADNTRDMVAKGRAYGWQKDKTHCKHGHEFTPENTYRAKSGSRSCRTCMKVRSRLRSDTDEFRAKRAAYMRSYLLRKVAT